MRQTERRLASCSTYEPSALAFRTNTTSTQRPLCVAVMSLSIIKTTEKSYDEIRGTLFTTRYRSGDRHPPISPVLRDTWHSLWTRPERAVSPDPGNVPVWAEVARALIVGPARPMAAAGVWAVGQGSAHEQGGEE